jgi:thiol-disulfide isomerase/thioredoxin
MKYVSFYLLFVICSFLDANSQVKSDSIRLVKIGEKLPSQFWSTPFNIYQNGSVTTTTLNHLKGKLILLDFWATWCGACIDKFPELEILQQKFGNGLKILGVSTPSSQDDLKKVSELFEAKIPPYKHFTHPALLDGAYLKKLFPYHALPYYIWIDSSGQLMAITGSAFVSEHNIKEVLVINKQSF